MQSSRCTNPNLNLHPNLNPKPNPNPNPNVSPNQWQRHAEHMAKQHADLHAAQVRVGQGLEQWQAELDQRQAEVEKAAEP